MLNCQLHVRHEVDYLRGNTSGTELSVVEAAGQLGDGVTGTGEEVEEEGRGDIGTGRVLDLLKGGGEAVLVGAKLSVSSLPRPIERQLTLSSWNKPQ